MMVVFAGGFLASIFLGEPLLTPFRNTQAVLLASAVWYSTYYRIQLKFHTFLI